MRVVCVQEIIFLRGRKTQQRGGRRDKEDGDDCFRLFVSHDLDRASKRNLNLGRIRVLLKPMTTPDIVHLVLLFPTQKKSSSFIYFYLITIITMDGTVQNTTGGHWLRAGRVLGAWEHEPRLA